MSFAMNEKTAPYKQFFFLLTICFIKRFFCLLKTSFSIFIIEINIIICNTTLAISHYYLKSNQNQEN